MNGIEISSDPARLGLARLHRFLSRAAHGSRGIERAAVERSIRHPLCFGAYRQGGDSRRAGLVRTPGVAQDRPPRRRMERHFPAVYGVSP